jgi:hypothetical protein
MTARQAAPDFTAAFAAFVDACQARAIAAGAAAGPGAGSEADAEEPGAEL